MQNTESTELKGLLTLSSTEVNSRASAREESGLVVGGNPVATASALGLFLQPRSSQHSHNASKKTVDNLETTGAASVYGTKVLAVESLALKRLILENNVGRLKDLDWQRVFPVLSDGL